MRRQRRAAVATAMSSTTIPLVEKPQARQPMLHMRKITETVPGQVDRVTFPLIKATTAALSVQVATTPPHAAQPQWADPAGRGLLNTRLERVR